MGSEKLPSLGGTIILGVEFPLSIEVRTSYGRGRVVIGDGYWDSGFSTRSIAAAVIQYPGVPRQDEGNSVRITSEFLIYEAYKKRTCNRQKSRPPDFDESPSFKLVIDGHSTLRKFSWKMERCGVLPRHWHGVK
ncbi:hypothetical protein AVEN_116819-1 [Araneus ventricosus]|uniref:Uncharacterized protein n=1 Tax=Araneus ventricosus TaxID=182803 RepID=A0A4Y2NY01_ARAVE|nr:hypothetical protein AVEN_116819-1 [Araneus ventricosus]